MKILTDLHTHTLASSHAYSTLSENAAAAAAAGLEAIAITDHCGTIPDAPHIWHLLNLKCLPSHINGVRILHGVEVNITDIHGTLDIESEILKELDIVVASLHTPCYADNDKTDHTEAYMNVVENPYVDIIGHSGNPLYPFDYDAVIRRAGELGKLIEINAASFRGRVENVPNCRKIAQLCKKYEVGIAVDSDSHYCGYIGNFAPAVEMLKEIEFPEKLIKNRSLQVLCEFMSPRKTIKI